MLQMRHSTPSDRDLVGIVPWRRRRLCRAGFAPRLADELARDPRTDVHALLELVGRGCPPALAVRILAPLDEDGRHGR